jgi:diguanylate cyclase
MFGDSSILFLVGIAIGALLLLTGASIGYWLGAKAVAQPNSAPSEHLLAFLRSMSHWTTEFSGDVHKVQQQLQVISERVRSGDAPKEELLRIVATIMATNSHLQERLQSAEKRLELQTDLLVNFEDQARTDALTGLRNRRAFDKSLLEMTNDWQQQRRRYCIGIIDIDHFKKINDSLGHPAGDAALRQVARLIQSQLSTAVVVARYGGEEFSFLAYAELLETAREVDRLRDLASKMIVDSEGVEIRLTLSAGLAQIMPEEESDLLVRRADQALYAAKSAGRNRVCWHDGERCQLYTPNFSSSADSFFPESGSAGRHSSYSEGGYLDEEVISQAQARLNKIVQEENQRFNLR